MINRALAVLIKNRIIGQQDREVKSADSFSSLLELLADGVTTMANFSILLGFKSAEKQDKHCFSSLIEKLTVI